MATEYGLQLFSVRDITGNDLEGTLRAVAEMGYKYVEYAGFFGHSAEQVKEWQDKYEGLWKQIMELPAVAEKIYDKGRQQGTTFNRNLVANILHLMAEKKVLALTANATKMAEVLEGDANASVRAKLGELPLRVIEQAVESLIG